MDLDLKKCEKDVEAKLSKSYVYNAKRDSKMADLFISSAKFLTDLYRRAFWYDGEILEVGFPRNDIFSYVERKEIRQKVLNQYGIAESKKFCCMLQLLETVMMLVVMI